MASARTHHPVQPRLLGSAASSPPPPLRYRRNFLDGDLIEHFLDLSRENQEEVCKAIAQEGGGEHTVESLLRIVEEMHRMH